MLMRWKQTLSKKESFRGAIRGASHRERLLHPSPAKAAQRRIRSKLLRSYALRFGQDEFFAQMNFWKELPRPGGKFWIRRRFAHWKVRLLGKTQPRPFALVTARRLLAIGPSAA